MCVRKGSVADSEETPQPGGDSLEVIPGSKLLWRIAPRPVNSTQVSSRKRKNICLVSRSHRLHYGFVHAQDVQLHNIRDATQRAGQRDRRRDS